MEKPILHVVSLSGGKDSTAMLLRMIEEGMPVDIILFCDTGLEFEGMYNHIDRLEKYIGKPITRLKSPHDFEYLFLEHMPKRNNPELVGRKGYSWGGPRNRWCTSMLKIRIINKYLRELSKQYTLVQYVGIAADEPHRVRDLRYPLIEWGMTEKDCLEYCKVRGFDWDGLYDIFHRVSCWCCPLQSFDEMRKLRKHFPELWRKLGEWDKKTWRKFTKYYSVEELEIRFAYEDELLAQGKSIKDRAFFAGLKKRLEDRK